MLRFCPMGFSVYCQKTSFSWDSPVNLEWTQKSASKQASVPSLPTVRRLTESLNDKNHWGGVKSVHPLLFVSSIFIHSFSNIWTYSYMVSLSVASEAKGWCRLHTEGRGYSTHLDTEAVGGIGGTVGCSASFHWALDGPRCVQAAPVIQGQAVLRGWWWRWRECGERWGYKSLLTASTILRALLEKRERRVKKREGKVGWGV